VEYVETVVIGAGQAGLTTAQRLRQRGRDCVVLDHNHRIGDNWRRQWDSLRLYSPARFDGLPGLKFPGDPWSFPTKDDVAAYLEAYAGRWDLPVRLGVRVEHLTRTSGDRFVVTTDAGMIRTDNVVVATGSFGRTPSIPDFAPSWISRSSSCTRASTADPGSSGTGPSS
jgi:putative flavoprotein involved in K+ transport